MLYRLAAIPALLALVGGQPCATAPEPAADPVKFTTQRVANQTWFDLANCWGDPPKAPDRASDGVLLGLLQAANPQVMECMANPKNRGPAEKTTISVSTKVPLSGTPEHTITGENMTEAGEKCVREVVEKFVPNFNQHAGDVRTNDEAHGDGKDMEVATRKKKKAKKIGGGGDGDFDAEELRALKGLKPGTAAALVKFVHDENQPQVKTGINDVSDAAAKIRLAMPKKMCSCFEPWKQADPAQVSILTTISAPAGKGQGPTGQPLVASTDGQTVKGKSTFDSKNFSHIKRAEDDPGDGAAGEVPDKVAPSSVEPRVPKIDSMLSQVAGCMADKIGKMKFKTPSQDLVVPYNFQFINSASGKPLTSGEPWAKYQQIEEVSRRRASETAIAVGARTNASTIYDHLVQKFQKNKYSVPINVLTAKCRELIKADDVWAASLGRQLEAEKQKKSVVTALAKTDAKWTVAKQMTAVAVETATKDLQTSKGIRKADAGACPQVSEVERH